MNRFSMGAAAALLLIAGTPQRGHAQPGPEAGATLYDAATDAYREGRFEEASAILREVYRRTNDPALLYNLYLSERERGRSRSAYTALRHYIVDADSIPDRSRVEALLDELACEIGESECSQPAPIPAATVSAPAEEVRLQAGPENAEERDSPALRIALAISAGALALVATGVSAGLGVEAWGSADLANSGQLPQPQAALEFEHAERLAGGANIGWVVAGSLTTTSILFAVLATLDL